MKYLERRVGFPLWIIHLMLFGYLFSFVNGLIDDPGTSLLAAAIAAVPVGAVLLVRIRVRRRRESRP